MTNRPVPELSRTLTPGIPDIPRVRQEIKKTSFDWTLQIRLLHALLQQRGELVTLNEVMASSGDAFHFSHASRWELRTAHAMPIDPLMQTARSFGYAASWTCPDWTPHLLALPMEQRLELTHTFLQRLWGEVAQGKPLLFGGAFGQCSDWRILAGFDLDSQEMYLVGEEPPAMWTAIWDEKARDWGFWDMQVRGAIREDEFLGGWQANACFLLGDKQTDIPERSRVLNTLNLAVRLSLEPLHSTNWYGGVSYYFGQLAFEQWANDLLLMEYPDILGATRPETPDIYNLDLMVYQVEQVIFGRKAAAAFCKKAATVLQQPILQEAAKAYDQQAAVAEDALGIFLQDDPLSRHAWLSDPGNRRKAASAVHELLAQEQQAVDLIQKALSI